MKKELKEKDEIIKAYNRGLDVGWKLANNQIKDALRPWFKGVHNIKLPNLK